MIKLKSLLIEGGHLFPDVVGIKQEEVESTLKSVESTVLKKLKLAGLGKDAFLLGSAGKKPKDQLSGDLDVGLSTDQIASANNISLEQVMPWLEAKLKKMGYVTKPIPGFSQVSIAFPIVGRDTDKCQVDFMLSSNLDWTTFIYYSPDLSKGESKYKGVYRNFLFGAIVSELKPQILKSTESGVPIEIKRLALRFNDGVFTTVKSFAGRDGSILKTGKLLHDKDKLITNTPDKFVRLLFGKGIKVDDVRTFEQTYDLTFRTSTYLKPYRDAIKKKFLSYVESAKLPIPDIVS